MPHTTGGGVFIDLGANIGAFSLFMASHGWMGYAFEASEHNAGLLKESVRLNNYNISVINKAVYDYTGSLYFYDNGPWGNARKEKVLSVSEEISCVALDDMMDGNEFKDLKEINLIKIDIEGSEVAALRGMRKFLEKYGYPPMFMEVNALTLFSVSKETPGTLIKLANDMGYKAYIIENDNTLTLRKSTQFQMEICMDVLLMKDIPENFPYPIVDKAYPDDEFIINFIVNSLLDAEYQLGVPHEHVMAYILYTIKDFPEYYGNARIKSILDTIKDNPGIHSNALEWYTKK